MKKIILTLILMFSSFVFAAELPASADEQNLELIRKLNK